MRIRTWLPAVLFISILILSSAYLIVHQTKPDDLQPWHCIGGCGVSAGGSGGGQSAVRWIGKGVAGSLFEIEAMIPAGYAAYTDSIAPYQLTSGLYPSFVWHGRNIDCRVAIPVSASSAPMKNKAAGLHTVSGAGLGDITVDVTRHLGTAGNISPTIGLSFPAGKSDIYDGFNLLPSQMQCGSGRFGGWIGCDITLDFDWGFVLFSPSYSGGLLYLKTDEWRYDRTLDRGVALHQELTGARGADGFSAVNDVGVTASDRLTLAAGTGIRTGLVTHGAGVNITVFTGNNSYLEYSYQEWLKDGNGKFIDTIVCKDPSSAQDYANQSTMLSFDFTKGEMVPVPRYSNPTVVGRDSTLWKVRTAKVKKVRSFPVLGLQYSAEIAAVNRLPILIGLSIPIALGNGPDFFMGASLTCGFRFGW